VTKTKMWLFDSLNISNIIIAALWWQLC